MELRTGNPIEEGRYIVFSRCESYQVKAWCEPSIATWHGGKWHFRWTVWGWIGPLPVVRWDHFKKQEYDL